jgi:hypothetical protein
VGRGRLRAARLWGGGIGYIPTVSLLWTAVGLVVVAVALLDLGWTAIAAGSGAGPITGRVTHALWRASLRVHARRPSHRFLSVTGVGIVVSVLVMWVLAVLTGWFLVFAAGEGSVESSSTGRSAGLVDRIYFTGYTVFTLGIGDYVPADGWTQVAAVLATATGLFLVTLSITYLVPAASGVTQRRQMAAYITTLGTSPAEILTRSWSGQDFGLLDEHLVAVTPMVVGNQQRLYTFPLLHFFHTVEDDAAATLRITDLMGAVDLLEHGVRPEHQPPPSVLGPLRSAIEGYLRTLHQSRIDPGDEPLAAPPLDPLRRAGIPVVDDRSYARAVEASDLQRRQLAGYLEDDGRLAERSARHPVGRP